MIPLFKPYICQEAKDGVLRVLDSGWLGLGPEVEAFEKEFASYLGAKHAVAFNSGTGALEAAITCLDSVDVLAVSTPNTFVSTNHVLLQHGYDIIFADIDPMTGNIDLDSVERLLTAYHPGVIMIVHYGGQPVDIDRLYEMIEGEEGTEVIEDCAHACGSTYKGRKIGSNSRFACFSFHAVKNLPTGDGGMLVTSEKWIADKARRLRWLGIDKSTRDRTNVGYSWEYDVHELGYKSHMNDITAAIGRAQLKRVDGDNQRRQELVDLYRKGFDGCEMIQLLTQSPNSQSSNHLMEVRCKDREKIVRALTRNDIQFGCHYKPNYLYHIYNECERENGCKGMEEFYQQALTLPLHLFLRDCDVEHICEVMKGSE